MAFTRGWGEEIMESYCFNVYRVYVENDEDALEMFSHCLTM